VTDFAVDGLNSKYAEKTREEITVTPSPQTTQTKKGPLEVAIWPGRASPLSPRRWAKGMTDISNEMIRLIM
jgi:hypothetical protein